MNRGWGKGLVVFLAVCLLGPRPGTAADPVGGAGLEEAAGAVLRAFPVITGTLLRAEPDGRVFVHLEPLDQAFPGLELEVARPGQSLRHPTTGELLGTVDDIVGALRVTEVRGRFAVAIPAGPPASPFTPGDRVRVATGAIAIALADLEAPAAWATEARALTRDFALALSRTGRFLVLQEAALSRALPPERLRAAGGLADPALLQDLHRTLRVQALLRGRLIGDIRPTRLEVEVTSTTSGRVLALAEADLGAAAGGGASASAPIPPPAGPSRPPVASPTPTPSPPPLVARPVQPSPHPDFIPDPAFGRRAAAGEEARGTRRVQTLPTGVRAIDFGDLDGDGQQEMVGITPQDVIIFAWRGGAFAEAERFPGPRHRQHLALDVADINGNGRAEIFVTSLDSRIAANQLHNRLASFVLERAEGPLAPIWQEVPLYFRVLKTVEEPRGLLLAMGMGENEPYRNPVLRYVWERDRYVRDPGFVLPDGLGLYGFTLADLDGDREREIVVLGADGFVRVFSHEGKLLAESREEFGGVDHIWFEQLPREKRSGLRDDFTVEDAVVRRFLQRRLVLAPLAPGGRLGILLGRNERGFGSRLLRDVEFFAGGNLTTLAWDGRNLATAWQTEVDKKAYIADYGLTVLDGRSALAALTWERTLATEPVPTLEVFLLAAAGAPPGRR